MRRSVRSRFLGAFFVLALVALLPGVPLPFPGFEPAVAVAQTPEDVEHGVDLSPHRAESEWVGENVSLLTGNVVESRIDVSHASPHRLELAFSAFHNSRSTASGALGYGWSHTYAVALTPPAGAGEPLKVVDATGRAHYFVEGTSGVFTGLYRERTTVRRLTSGRYFWKCADGTLYNFDETGRLAYITDAVGNILNLRYTQVGLLDLVRDLASGRVLRLWYRADGRLDYISGAVTPAVPDGRWVTYGYDANGNLASVTYADGSGFTYEYGDASDPHNVTRKRDVPGHVLGEWSYDASDRCVGNATRDDRSVTIAYVSAVERRVTDAYGVQRAYTLGTPGGRARVTGVDLPNAPYARDGAVRWAFDAQARLIEVELGARLVNGIPVGTVHRFRNFDGRGNPGTITLAYGDTAERVLACTYHTDTSALLSVSEPSVLGIGQKITTWDHDDPADPNDDPAVYNQNPTSLPRRIIEQGATRNASGTGVRYTHITTLAYNAKGQVVSIDGPADGTDDTTTQTYATDTFDLLTVTRPLVGTTTFSQYDGTGLPRRVKDVNNRVRDLAYDGRGRLLSSTHLADNETSRVTYDTSGSLASETDEDEVARSYTYDGAKGLLATIVESTGNSIAFTRDTRGNVIAREYLDGSANPPEVTRIDRFDYDGPAYPGLLHREIQADDTYTEYTYDPGGRVASVRAPSGRTTSYAYDAFGRVTQVTDPSGAVTSSSYDRYGNLIRVEDPDGRATTFTYDDMSRLVETVSPDTGTTRARYDASGNLLSKTDAAGVVTSYTYDALNRRTRASFPAAGALPSYVISYLYDRRTDGKGRLTDLVTPTETTALDHDARGRVIRKTAIVKWNESDPTQTVSFAVARTLSAGGRPLTVTYPSGRIVEYLRPGCACNVGEVRTTHGGNTRTLASAITYRPFGGATGMSLAGAATVENRHDLSGRLIESNPGTALARAMTYDADGRLTGISAPGAPWRNFEASYDLPGRLERQVGAGGTVEFGYDGAGNRLDRTVTRTWGTEITTYALTPGTDRIASETTGAVTTPYTHDARGNVSTLGDKTLVYDQEGRLQRVLSGATTLGSYGYDGFGARVRKTAGGVVTLYVTDFDGNLIGEANSSGTFAVEYLYRGRVRLARTTPGATTAIYTYANNEAGAPEMLLDATRSAVWEGIAKPFGEVSVRAGSTLTENFRYQGQYYDAETGFHYNHHRYYDPKTGRYLAPDPIGLKGGINPYVYVQNDPVNLVDPLGLWTFALRLNFTLVIYDITFSAVVDEQLNVAIQSTVGIGASISVGASLGGTWISAPTLYCLENIGTTIGAAASIPPFPLPGFGVEINRVWTGWPNQHASSYSGWDVGAGVSIGAPVTPQGFVGVTTTYWRWR